MPRKKKPGKKTKPKPKNVGAKNTSGSSSASRPTTAPTGGMPGMPGMPNMGGMGGLASLMSSMGGMGGMGRGMGRGGGMPAGMMPQMPGMGGMGAMGGMGRGRGRGMPPMGGMGRGMPAGAVPGMPGMRGAPQMNAEQMKKLQEMIKQGKVKAVPAQPGMHGAGMPFSHSHAVSQDTSKLFEKYKIDPKRWRCVYPCYLDKNKTIERARKIAKKYCVERPSVHDIADVCKYLGLPFYIEFGKRHPRNFFDAPGRVRVLLKKEDNKTLRRQDIRNRYQLLIALGKMIPKLETRKRRLETEKRIKAQRAKMIEQQKKEQEKQEKAKQEKADLKKKKKEQRGNVKSGRGKGRRGRGRRR